MFRMASFGVAMTGYFGLETACAYYNSKPERDAFTNALGSANSMLELSQISSIEVKTLAKSIDNLCELTKGKLEEPEVLCNLGNKLYVEGKRYESKKSGNFYMRQEIVYARNKLEKNKTDFLTRDLLFPSIGAMVMFGAFTLYVISTKLRKNLYDSIQKILN